MDIKDFSTLNEILKKGPNSINLGTDYQDCNLIAQTFERGAHSVPNEAAVFGPMTRRIQNTKKMAETSSKTLNQYLISSPKKSTTSSGIDPKTDGDNQILSAELSMGIDPDITGNKFLDTLRDCIPCDLRLQAFLELHPNINLLDALEGSVLSQLSQLKEITNLLNNVDAFGDFCNLLEALNFICIPDLQRMLAALMAMLSLEIPSLDGLIGMLQAIIAPLFAPLLYSITGLLDQFSILVTSPLDCVISAINQQLQKTSLEINQQNALNTGLTQLNTMIAQAKLTIENKLEFYINQIKAMTGEMSANDAAYLRLSLRKLEIIRMLGFIKSIIDAKRKGHPICNSNKSPEIGELDNFFQDFLNPNGAFNLWVDDNGEIQIDEKVKEMKDVIESNILEYEGENLLNPEILNITKEVSANLSSSLKIKTPCKLKTNISDVDKVNQWIADLNK